MVVTDGMDRLSDGAQIKRRRSDCRHTGAVARMAAPRDHRAAHLGACRDTAPQPRKHARPAPMNFSRLFILRPVATSLLMIALVLVGLVAMRFLPVSSLPDVDYPTIQVQTFYPGASPDVMATTVTAPLEVQLGEIPGLQQMISYSSEGASVITLQFDLSLNLDVAEQNVQQAINAANSFLPSGLPAPPTYAKVNPADQPILTLAVTSKSMSLTQLQDIANNRLAHEDFRGARRRSRDDGGRQRAGRARRSGPAKARRLRSESSTICARCSRTSTSASRRAISTGPSSTTRSTATIRSSTRQDYLDTVIAYQNGAPVYPARCRARERRPRRTWSAARGTTARRPSC